MRGRVEPCQPPVTVKSRFRKPKKEKIEVLKK
jgi:hypothetical protein